MERGEEAGLIGCAPWRACGRAPLPRVASRDPGAPPALLARGTLLNERRLQVYPIRTHDCLPVLGEALALAEHGRAAAALVSLG
jgi:hypothetical protein